MAQPALIAAQITVEQFKKSVEFLKRVEKKEARVLALTGGFGKAYLRQRIRRRKKISAVNAYPSAHTPGASGLKDMRFAVSEADLSVSIGPFKHGDRKDRPRPIGKTVPQLLNEGGLATFRGEVWRYQCRPFRELAFPDIYSKFLDNIEKVRL